MPRIDLNNLTGRRILLAEDNLTNQEITLAVLNQANIHVDIANNGKEAVLAVFQNPYDSVLMDMQMPVMDGYEATLRIRKNAKFTNLPIIAMTAHAMKGDNEKCFAAGMNGYISKPINQQRLFNTLGKHLHGRPHAQFNQPMQPEKESDQLPKGVTEKYPGARIDLPGIDAQGAMAALALDEDTFKRILIGFHRNNLLIVEKIETAFKQENWQELLELAHSLKGSAGNIGAKALQDSALTVESASKASSKRHPDENMVNILIHELKMVLSSLEVLKKTKQNDDITSRIETDTVEVKQTIKLLIESLENTDPSKVTKYFDELSRLLGDDKTAKLSDDIASFDYENALVSLDEISLNLTPEKTWEG